MVSCTMLFRAVQQGGIPSGFSITESDQLRILERASVERWNTSWQGSPKGLRYRGVQRDIPSRPWFSGAALSRSHITVICRMRFGHIRLNYHLFKLGLVESPDCDCGQDLETIDHIFFGCPLRDALDIYFKFKKISFPVNIEHLLALNSPKINSILFKSILENCIKI